MRGRVRLCRGLRPCRLTVATGGSAVLTDGVTRVPLQVVGGDLCVDEGDLDRFPGASELTIETAAGTPDVNLTVLPNPRS